MPECTHCLCWQRCYGCAAPERTQPERTVSVCCRCGDKSVLSRPEPYSDASLHELKRLRAQVELLAYDLEKAKTALQDIARATNWATTIENCRFMAHLTLEELEHKAW